MSTPKEVTILLPIYNGATTLARAINSILAQTYQDWTLLVLDDGSQDNTLSIAHSFGDDRIQVISDGLHLGIVARLNHGIYLCKTPYIARMDADDISHPERLEKQIAFLDLYPSVDLVGSSIRILDNTGRVLGERIFPTSHAKIIAQPWLKSLSVAHPTWCGRTEWFKKWQYQNYLRNEDQEMLFRASSESIYANLSNVLLDYYDTPSFSKKLLARWGWTTVLWVHYAKKGHFSAFVAGVVITTTKFFRSILSR